MSWQSRVERALRERGFREDNIGPMTDVIHVLEGAGDKMADVLYDLTNKASCDNIKVVAEIEKILGECEAAKERLRQLI
jgi:hypothetical protein